MLRRRAQTDLLAFTEFTFKRYQTSAHHVRIAEALQAIERRDINKLIIEIPPRGGKSELVSKRFPAWYLGRNPHKEIIAASYGSDLARDFGRAARNIVASEEYQSIFPYCRLAADTSAADRWMTMDGGSYVAAGVGTAITGRGAHVGIIDDPVKDRAEAESQIVRDSTWGWYTSTFLTRLTPDGAQVICQTRWHYDDLTGRIKARWDKERVSYEEICIPALVNGLSYWPERWTKELLEQRKAEIGARDWQSLYMQQPTPDEGAFYRRDWFRYYDKLPKDVAIIAASDHAATMDGGDYTVHGVAALDSNDNLYIDDVWRRQCDAQEWLTVMVGLVRSYQPMRWGVEVGPIWRTAEPWIRDELAKHRAYVDVRAYPTAHNGGKGEGKSIRSLAFQSRLAAGKVFFRRGAPFLDWLEPEMLQFPAGVHDDGCDVLALLGRMAAEIPLPMDDGWSDEDNSRLARSTSANDITGY
jgi:hypothetical protein